MRTHQRNNLGSGRRCAAVCSLALFSLSGGSHAFSAGSGVKGRAALTNLFARRSSSHGEFEFGYERAKYIDASFATGRDGSKRRSAAGRKAKTATALGASASGLDSLKKGGRSERKARQRKKNPVMPKESMPKESTLSRKSLSPLKRIRISKSETSGARIQRIELVDHDLLTKEQDLDLGTKVARASELRTALADLVEERRLTLLDEQRIMKRQLDDVSSEWMVHSENAGDFDFHMSEFGVYDSGTMSSSVHGEYDDDDISESNGFSIIEQENAAASKAAHKYIMVDEGSRFSANPIEADLRILSDEDIVDRLHMTGGREEVRGILREGADARETLMRCNMRLVVNISKKWIKRGNSNGLGLSSLYSGGWDKPSLDEVIQEGFIGLARAVDKYDAKRGLRFSTYATHWITSYVRQTFQKAATGCLRVPAQLHDIKLSYKKLMRQYYDESMPIPSGDDIAAELGVSRNRLETALRVTESLLSVDQPMHTSGARHKGSGAGGDLGDTELLISDILKW
mmetsp:Transcript_59003/g.175436  ORF Transcript_59003/g.175436 Transcript_59003/m.175436 type:complete len:515 (-) Transcript_59003:577-2121(-)